MSVTLDEVATVISNIIADNGVFPDKDNRVDVSIMRCKIIEPKEGAGNNYEKWIWLELSNRQLFTIKVSGG